MAEHVNRETVQSRLDRLDDRYDVGYREDERVTVDPAPFEKEIAAAREGYFGSSYVWIVRRPEQAHPLAESMPDDVHVQERVLMILGRGGTAWAIPGGGREAGETFEESARREVREETGIECTVEGCFGTRYERRTTPEHDEILHTLRVVFTGEYAGGSITIQPSELNGAAWRTSCPDRLHPLAEPVAAEWFEE